MSRVCDFSFVFRWSQVSRTDSTSYLHKHQMSLVVRRLCTFCVQNVPSKWTLAWLYSVFAQAGRRFVVICVAAFSSWNSRCLIITRGLTIKPIHWLRSWQLWGRALPPCSWPSLHPSAVLVGIPWGWFLCRRLQNRLPSGNLHLV